MMSLDPRKWFQKEEVKPAGAVGVSASANGLALSYGVERDGQFTIEMCEFAAVAPQEQLQFAKDWVAQHGLKNADCHFVLHEQDYELQLLETPPVAEDELREAVRWRLKDLIQTPLDEVVIDIFPLPDDAYRGRMKMLYAVAVKTSVVKNTLKLIRAAGLQPSVIDISEMALRNLSLYLPEMEHGTVALLRMQESSGAMLMYSHDALYLTRQIELGYSSFISEPGALSLDNGVMVERLSLDLQRSLDYYESQLGKGVANKIYVLPMENEFIHFEDDLKKSLHTPLLYFDCREHLPLAQGVNPSLADQAHCLTAMGAVLRRVA